MIRVLLVILTIAVSSATVFAAPLDPCKLLTQTQVSQAFAEPAPPAKPQPSAPDYPICGWVNGSQSKTLYVMIASRKTMPPPWWKAAVPVHGVGEKAVWMGGWMYVRKHANRVVIELVLSPNSTTRMDPQLLRLAKQVAARMP